MVNASTGIWIEKDMVNKLHKSLQSEKNKADIPSKPENVNEIDSIFTQKKKRLNSLEKHPSQKSVIKSKKKNYDEKVDNFFDSRGKISPQGRQAHHIRLGTTEDGLPLYNADELFKERGSGSSNLCPFDCDCCY